MTTNTKGYTMLNLQQQIAEFDIRFKAVANAIKENSEAVRQAVARFNTTTEDSNAKLNEHIRLATM